MDRKKPYVGISGVVSPDQQEFYLDIASGIRLREKRELALGIKAVHKTQYLGIDNKYGRKWYPVGNEIGNCVSANAGTYNIAQVYLEPENIKSSLEYPRIFMEKLMSRGRAVIHAVQFDMLPFDQDTGMDWNKYLEYIKKEYGTDIILQCHRRAMGDDPDCAVTMIEKLSDNLDYVLFDASHGAGIEMNPDDLMRYCDRAYESKVLADRRINFGVAGGLDGDMIRRQMPKILAEFPDISWDAEGKLHKGAADNSLNNKIVKDYLRASADVLDV